MHGIIASGAAFVHGQAPAEGKRACAQCPSGQTAGCEADQWGIAKRLQHQGNDGPSESGGDVKFALFKDKGDFVADHIAHQTAKGAGDHAHDQDDGAGLVLGQRDRDASRGGNCKGEAVEPQKRAVAAFQKMRREKDQHGGCNRHADVGRLGDPEDRVTIQQDVAQRPAAYCGECCDEGKAHKIQLGAGCCEGTGQRKDRDRSEIQ